MNFRLPNQLRQLFRSVDELRKLDQFDGAGKAGDPNRIGKVTSEAAGYEPFHIRRGDAGMPLPVPRMSGVDA